MRMNFTNRKGQNHEVPASIYVDLSSINPPMHFAKVEGAM